jgi:uncharacterized protein (DUF58 family)
VREFEEHSNLAAYMVVDASLSMHFADGDDPESCATRRSWPPRSRT